MTSIIFGIVYGQSCRVIRRNVVTVRNNTRKIKNSTILMIPLEEAGHGQTPSLVGR